jgi:hypothetical protein
MQVLIQAVSPRPITEETWVQYLAIPYGMCAAQTKNAKCISPFTYILPISNGVLSSSFHATVF